MLSFIMTLLQFLTLISDNTSTLGQSAGATSEVVYDYPETSTDPNVEKCAAYGVITSRNL